MISLRALLIEDDSDNEERSVWKTYSGRWAARNTMGKVRYFKDREKAADFSRGNIEGPRQGRPKRPKRKEPKERLLKYDYTPVVKHDMEQRM